MTLAVEEKFLHLILERDEKHVLIRGGVSDHTKTIHRGPMTEKSTKVHKLISIFCVSRSFNAASCLQYWTEEF